MAPGQGPAAAAAAAFAAAAVAAAGPCPVSTGGGCRAPAQVMQLTNGCSVHVPGPTSFVNVMPQPGSMQVPHPGSMHVPQPGSLALPPAARIELAPIAPPGPLADPDTIRKQKEQYAVDLEEQLKKGVEVLGETHKQKMEELHARANQEKTRYNLAMDQQVKQQELVLSQQYNEQLMRLQQAAQAKRAELEQQATSLTLEFQQRKVQEEFMVSQRGIQQQHHEAQARLTDEMTRLGLAPPSAPSVTNYAAPPTGGAPGMQAVGMMPYVPPTTGQAPRSVSVVRNMGSSMSMSSTAPPSYAYSAPLTPSMSTSSRQSTGHIRASYASPSGLGRSVSTTSTPMRGRP